MIIENIDVLILLLVLEAALAMKRKHYNWHLIWLPYCVLRLNTLKTKGQQKKIKGFVKKENQSVYTDVIGSVYD